MRDVAAVSANFVVLDHHTSAAVAMAGRFERTFFDFDRSGAMLAWQYFHPGVAEADAPLLIQYIQDTDLWRFALPNAADFSAALKAQPRLSLQFLSTLLDHDELDRFIARGSAIRSYIDAAVARQLPTAGFRAFHGYETLILNASANMSELGNELARLAPIGLVYYTNHAAAGRIKVSLRTVDPAIDVSALAALHGGGGHAKAAAFVHHGSSIDELFDNAAGSAYAAAAAAVVSSASAAAAATRATPPATRPASDARAPSGSDPRTGARAAPPAPTPTSAPLYPRPPPGPPPGVQSKSKPTPSSAPITPLLPSMSTMASMLSNRAGTSPPPTAPSPPPPASPHEAARIQAKIIEHMLVPHHLVGFILGRGGSAIRSIRTASGAFIKIQNRSEVAPDASGRRVTFSGTQQQVSAARELIKARMVEAELNFHRRRL
ncbi:vacuolar proton pump subunit F [Thecamonas trahens ATCC 50062]|uniref:Vacuolar proton pump subunit F n=1 Tax=Thecamonas trahens ATCC 50062 TaxID=461836 RepID=A0A0L0DQT2_THETB|nr:vacuolar proton pump subunit F [Thecamonas trahens ATCC 50062]KNC54635.1 vacuolar proton pump subunit F [Thecamonas trahens ATCC 50062]|eukprot:XP_013761542.1 vacuolar proton pump subunit F [Thecamonas trahens ATCC 50062]